jgi:hypothetical protein
MLLMCRWHVVLEWLPLLNTGSYTLSSETMRCKLCVQISIMAVEIRHTGLPYSFVILPGNVFHWPPASDERSLRFRHCLRMFMEYSSSQKR